MTLTAEELSKVSAVTIGHYQRQADQFEAGTRDHDVRQNIDALLRHIEASAPLDILDFGCGPGRDLRTFTEMGHHAVGLDGCPRFVEMARANSGCEVWLQDFLALDLPVERFDGIFANAVLFHARCCPLCCASSKRPLSPVAFCSAPTHAVTTRKAGMANATGPTTT